MLRNKVKNDKSVIKYDSPTAAREEVYGAYRAFCARVLRGERIKRDFSSTEYNSRYGYLGPVKFDSTSDIRGPTFAINLNDVEETISANRPGGR